MSTPDLKITSSAVIRETKVGTQVIAEEKDLFSTYQAMSDVAYFDTGLLPVDGTGVLAIRHAGDRTQFVYQHAPGVYYMIWGKGEGDKKAKELHVAQPYRIVIGDHVNGEMRGARHFYSPIPITSLDQQLYHCNVPNLNCKGYNGTSVGWICLYHKEKYAGLPLGQRIFKTIERASGHEAYNDNNMSGTDGPRFYAEKYKNDPKYTFLWDPIAWQNKTEADGVEWTLNPDLWIPIKVNGIDDQDAHNDSGTPLTLEMAMLGNYKAYYPSRAADEKDLSLMNQIVRSDKRNPTQKSVASLFSIAFNNAKKKQEEQKVVPQSQLPPGIGGSLLSVKVVDEEEEEAAAVTQAKEVVKKNYCHYCQLTLNDNQATYKDSNGSLICSNCFNTHFITTSCCGLIVNAGDCFAWTKDPSGIKYYCHGCHSLDVCPTCGYEHLDSAELLFDNHCMNCYPEPFYCDSCGGKHVEHYVHKVEALDPKDNGTFGSKVFTLCTNCFSQTTLCKCALLKADDTVNKMPDGSSVCGPCVTFTDEGQPVYNPTVIGITTNI